MEGGLGILGLGLFLLSIALLYAHTSGWLAGAVFALSLVSMGLAFSESPRKREASLGLGAAMLLLGAVALVTGRSWWVPLAHLAFALAYGVLWAEFRFSFFSRRMPDEPGLEDRPRSPRT